jgi:hypothetical protein
MFHNNVSLVSYRCFMYIAHAWMNDAYAHVMQVQWCKHNTGVLHILTFTRILQNVNWSALPESTILHLPVPLLADSQDVYTLLSPSPMPSA